LEHLRLRILDKHQIFGCAHRSASLQGSFPHGTLGKAVKTTTNTSAETSTALAPDN